MCYAKAKEKSGEVVGFLPLSSVCLMCQAGILRKRWYVKLSFSLPNCAN